MIHQHFYLLPPELNENKPQNFDNKYNESIKQTTSSTINFVIGMVLYLVNENDTGNRIINNFYTKRRINVFTFFKCSIVYLGVIRVNR